DGPLLIVGTARPDFIKARAGWGTGRYQADTIWLEPLSAASAGELIESVVGAALPEGTRSILVQRAEGNPLFIEEMLASLIDRGVIERNDGAWSVRELPSEIEIPDTIQALVAARLDLLGTAEKSAVHAAAGVGRIDRLGRGYT